MPNLQLLVPVRHRSAKVVLRYVTKHYKRKRRFDVPPVFQPPAEPGCSRAPPSTLKDFGPHLLRIKRLGFPDIRTHALVARLYVQALALFPERARDAFALLADVERRVWRMPKTRSAVSSC